MGKPLPPRVIRSGPYKPTLPRAGDADEVIFRKYNLITRGREGRYYEEVFSGLGNLNEPLNLGALTGTVSLVQDSPTVDGIGTSFWAECHPGQWLLAISSDDSTSWPLRVRRVISDTQMTVWQAPDSSSAGASLFAMSRLNASNQDRQTCFTGNVDPLDKGSYVGVGSGIVRLNGSTLSASWTLARAPSIALFDATSETFTEFTLGMDTPVAPSLAAVGGGTKDMQAGSYSLVITPARKETGGYNNPSPRADVTITTGDKVRITFPAMDTANGQNAWGVWVTPYQAAISSNLGYLQGPWFFYPGDSLIDNITVTDADVSPAGGTFDIEWLDAEVMVNQIVSFDNDAPTDAEWVGTLNNAPVWISCQGQGNATNPTQTSPGPFIVPVKPNNIEAAPLNLAFSSSPPETILWALSAQGRIYLLTPNHLQIAQSTPDDTVPILIRPYWKDGFAGPDALVFNNGTLYGWTLSGPSRSAGDGDESYVERAWAGDIVEKTQHWNTGHVLVGYDPKNIAIVFFCSGFRRNNSGFWTTAWLMYGLDKQFWTGEGEFTSTTEDQIVSGLATIGDRLALIVGGLGTVPAADVDLITEAADFLLTENGDSLLTE